MGVQESGSRQFVKIDGARVRAIREEKGLTQLYVATYVGVTTDTISRWENRKYPTIKGENARKLAEALEVELGEIVEREEKSPAPPRDRGEEEPPRLADGAFSTPSSPKVIKKWQGFVTVVLIVLLLSFLFHLWLTKKKEGFEPVIARRILPVRVAPESLFPVVIDLEGTGQDTSVIIKEKIPKSLLVVGYYPEASPLTMEKGAPRWIVSVPPRGLKFIYVLKVPQKTKMGKKLRFSGSIISKGVNLPAIPIEGDTFTLVGPYHWADRDANHVIDDQEILDAYDTFSQIDALKQELDRLEALWAKGKYEWPKQKTGDGSQQKEETKNGEK